MTKAELFEQLKDLPDDTIIVVNSQSNGDGYDDATEINEICVRQLEMTMWRGKYLVQNWRGKYAGCSINEPEENKIKAISIS